MGHKKACFNLGYFLEANSDFVASKCYYKKGCELGDMSSCNNLANYLFKGVAGEKDTALARNLYERACEANRAPACTSFGMVLKDMPKERSTAIKTFEKACALGDKDGCHNAGTAYLQGANVKKDTQKAKSHLEKACTTGQFQSCANLGIAYQSGEFALPKDPAAAMKFFKIGCELGDAKSCENLKAK